MTIEINGVIYNNVYLYSVAESAIKIYFNNNNTYTKELISSKCNHISKNFTYGHNYLIIDLPKAKLLRGISIVTTI